MLNTYIKNRGITETIIRDNGRNHFNRIDWDSDYDGHIANLSLNSNTDGKSEYFNVSLDNDDLANMLSVPTVNIPIDKRLKMDFENYHNKPEQLFIELPAPKLEPRMPPSSSPIEELISGHISSPKSGEEFIVPITIDKKTSDNYTLTPRRRHKKNKTHVTHRVYKKHKTNPKSKSKSKTSSRNYTHSKRSKL